jgi:hypothetical protein
MIDNSSLELLTVKQAADRANISPRRVRQLLKESRMAGKKLGRDWVVTDWRWAKNKKSGRGKDQHPRKHRITHGKESPKRQVKNDKS